MLERKVCKIGKEWFGGQLAEGVFNIDSGKGLILGDGSGEFVGEVAEKINNAGEEVECSITKLPKDAMERQDQECLVERDTENIVAVVCDIEFADRVVALFADSAK